MPSEEVDYTDLGVQLAACLDALHTPYKAAEEDSCQKLRCSQ